MKIISAFKDYYDHGMSFGQDPAIVFDRKTAHLRLWADKGLSYNPQVTEWFKSTRLEKLLRNMRSYRVGGGLTGNQGVRISLTSGYLVVAGKIYPVVVPDSYYHSDNPALLYSLEDIDAFVNAKDPAIEVSNHIREYFAKFFDLKIILDYDGSYEKLDPDYLLEDCLASNLPVFLVYGTVSLTGFCECYLTKNSSLKELGFSSQMNSAQVYQEIEMFLGLVKTRQPIPKADNNTKIVGHGFDLKESFRHRT